MIFQKRKYVRFNQYYIYNFYLRCLKLQLSIWQALKKLHMVLILNQLFLNISFLDEKNHYQKIGIRENFKQDLDSLALCISAIYNREQIPYQLKSIRKPIYSFYLDKPY